MSCGTSHDSEKLQLCGTATFLPSITSRTSTSSIHVVPLHLPYTPGRVLPPLCQPYQAINTACMPAFPTSACMLRPFSPTCAWERLPTRLLQTTFFTLVLEHVGRQVTCFIPAVDWPLDSLVPGGRWLGLLLGYLLWEMFILGKEPSLVVLCLRRTQQHPRDSACSRSAWSKMAPSAPPLQTQRVSQGAGHQRQQTPLLLFMSPRDEHSKREASLCLLTWLIGLKPLTQKQS